MFDSGLIEIIIAIIILLWASIYVGRNLFRQMTIGENADNCENCELHKHVMGNNETGVKGRKERSRNL